MTIRIVSFGYDKGRPPKADLTLDARHLPNPHQVPGLRPRTGRNRMVQDWLFDQPGVAEQITKWAQQAEQHDSIAIGCNAGRHRSVAIAEELATMLNTTAEHRELPDKNAKPRQVHVVTGPPCAGKTTFVTEHAAPGDLRIDYDHLANTLTGQPVDNHKHDRAHTRTFQAVRQAAITAALASTATVWIVDSQPSDTNLAIYRQHDATFHHLDPGQATVMQRIKAERPWQIQQAAKQWYAKQPTKPRTTTEKGLGWDHQKQRERLIRTHRDNTPCWWCELPMYRTKTRNWDGEPLHADHTQARANGGHKADRLLHGRCNKQRQSGTHDAHRPAVTGTHPRDWKAPTKPTSTPSGLPAGTASLI